MHVGSKIYSYHASDCTRLHYGPDYLKLGTLAQLRVSHHDLLQLFIGQFFDVGRTFLNLAESLEYPEIISQRYS